MSTRRKPKRKPSLPPVPQRKERPALRSRLEEASNRPLGQGPSWRLSLLDLEHTGSWSWNVNEGTLQEIIAFLKDMERLTWTEIRSQTHGGGHLRHHSIPVESLCTEARRRLQELRLDDLDELFEFRLGSRRRLWGAVPDDGIFRMLWWDPQHQVYPVEPG